jgi:hypothetical protein
MVSRFRHRRPQYCPGPAERALQPCTHDDAGTDACTPAIRFRIPLAIVAGVANRLDLRGVNWTVSCASAPCGTVSPSPTKSGVATTYTAPAPPVSDTQVTVTATDDDPGVHGHRHERSEQCWSYLERILLGNFVRDGVAIVQRKWRLRDLHGSASVPN